MNTNKKINLDPSKLYGFKIASHSLSQQQLPVVLGSKIGKVPSVVLSPKIGKVPSPMKTGPDV
ncbi:MAG: hypothetical protein QX190_06235 [Methylococcales bacterium]